MTRAPLALLATIALLLPVSAAEPSGETADGMASAPVTLYFHAGPYRDLPLNTQVPEGERPAHEDGSVGLGASSGCAPDNPVTTFGGSSRHRWYGWVSPSHVEYDVEENGQLRYHVQKGLGGDLRFDGEAGMMFHWYLEARAGEIADAPSPPIVPQVQVDLQLVESNDINVGHQAFHDARVLAQSRSDAVDLHPMVDHPQVTHHEVDGKDVYGFHFPVPFDHTVADAGDGLGAIVTVMMDNPHCTEAEDGGYMMPDLVSLHQSDGLWNRMEFRVFDAVSIEAVHLQYIGGDIVVHAAARSPFGAYDLIMPDELPVDGPGIQAFVPRADLVQRTYSHGHYFDDVTATWVWQLEEGATPGRYTAAVTVQNLQGTANATTEAVFDVGDGAVTLCNDSADGVHCTTHGRIDQEAPLSWALAVLAVVAGFIASSRRR